MRALRLLLVLLLAGAGLTVTPARAGVCPTPYEGIGPTPPVGTSTCSSGARPGGRVRTPVGLCTLNFVFADPAGNRYIGTAGHCVLKDSGGGTVRRWAADAGPPARIDGRHAGRFVYAAFTGVEDWALIQLDPGFPWSPAMAHFGGPTGMYTDRAATPVVVHHFGHGMGMGNAAYGPAYDVVADDVHTLSARSGVAPHTLDRHTVGFYGAAIFGDSGSGLITADGRALGTIVQLGSTTDGNNIASRLDYSVARAEAVLATTLTLQTAPLR